MNTTPKETRITLPPIGPRQPLPRATPEQLCALEHDFAKLEREMAIEAEANAAISRRILAELYPEAR